MGGFLVQEMNGVGSLPRGWAFLAVFTPGYTLLAPEAQFSFQVQKKSLKIAPKSVNIVQEFDWTII